jgi:hypothetical protein
MRLQLCPQLLYRTEEVPKCSQMVLPSSPDFLRMAYLVAVAFRNLVVEYEELRPVRHDSEFRRKWEELISRWRPLIAVNAVLSRILRDGTTSMN